MGEEGRWFVTRPWGGVRTKGSKDREKDLRIINRLGGKARSGSGESSTRVAMVPLATSTPAGLFQPAPQNDRYVLEWLQQHETKDSILFILEEEEKIHM